MKQYLKPYMEILHAETIKMMAISLQDGQADPDKPITVFTMQPMQGGDYRQEILGYSLMAALGIKSEELNALS